MHIYVSLYAIIMKLLFITLITLILLACNEQVPLSKSILTGKYALEITEYSDNLLDTTLTVFKTDSTYYRIGSIYLRKEGPYKIHNDSIQIKYGKSGNDKTGIQYYILNKSKQLVLVKIVEDNGNILTNDIIDTKLELLNFDSLKNKLHTTPK